MARQTRIEFPGAFYHTMARGDRREPIFLSDQDYHLFLKTLGEAATKTGWKVHAYALMPNHYHLLFETPRANLVAGMTWLQATYTTRFNARHRLRGHLFAGRYKAILVQHGEGDYFRSLLDYVHLNPVRAGLASTESGIEAYPWTSLAYYTATPSKRKPWQHAREGLACCGFRDSASGRKKFLVALEQRARAEGAEAAGLTEIEEQSLQSTLRRGWYFGTQAFAESLHKIAATTIRKNHANPNYYGPEVKANTEERARQIIDDGLTVFDLTPADLTSLPKSDWRKSLIALAITRETPVRRAWISEHLHMGATAGVTRYTTRIAKTLNTDRTRRRLFNKIVESS